MDEPRVAAEAPRSRWSRWRKSLLKSIAPLAPPVVSAALSALVRTLRVRLVDEEDLFSPLGARGEGHRRLLAQPVAHDAVGRQGSAGLYSDQPAPRRRDRHTCPGRLGHPRGAGLGDARRGGRLQAPARRVSQRLQPRGAAGRPARSVLRGEAGSHPSGPGNRRPHLSGHLRGQPRRASSQLGPTDHPAAVRPRRHRVRPAFARRSARRRRSSWRNAAAHWRPG